MYGSYSIFFVNRCILYFSYYFCLDLISSANPCNFVDVDLPCFLLMPFHICVVIWVKISSRKISFSFHKVFYDLYNFFAMTVVGYVDSLFFSNLQRSLQVVCWDFGIIKQIYLQCFIEEPSILCITERKLIKIHICNFILVLHLP